MIDATRAGALVLAVATACSVAAQNAPLPPEPYVAPIAGFVGRYLDSATVGKSVERGYHAWQLKVAPERDTIYVVMSYTVFAAYRLSTFADRVANEPLQVAPPPRSGEKYLPFEKSLDAAVGWPPNSYAGSLRLHSFDWDDRGLNYLAFSSYWGIVDDATFQPIDVIQFPSVNILAFRDGDRYYALVQGESESRLYEVTDPKNSTVVWTSRDFFGPAAKAADGTIAISHGGILQIHTPETLVAGAREPLAQFDPEPPSDPMAIAGFAYIATDGSSFYVVEHRNLFGIPDLIRVVSHTEDGWVSTVHEGPDDLKQRIAYGEGYVTVGRDRGYEIHRVTDVGLIPLNATYLGFNGWMGSVLSSVAQPVRIGGKLMLITASGGLGEVYLLTGPKRRSTRH